MAVTVAVMLSACGGGHDRVDVQKFCPLASMPHGTLAEVTALRARGAGLLGGAKELKYARSTRNERIVDAALALLEAARVTQVKLTHPKEFPPGSTGIDGYAGALKSACAKPH